MPTVHHSIATNAAPALLLLFALISSCGEADRVDLVPPSMVIGSVTPEVTGPGDNPELGPGGAAGSGGTEPLPPPVNPSPDGLCFSDADCDDGLFCNGVELCKSQSPGADIKVCMAPQKGPCGANACDEASHCDCSHPDRDGDGSLIQGCTDNRQYDCDDDDGRRYPGNAETCDDRDDDCSDETYGVKDADGDGHIDGACTNTLFYQPLLRAPDFKPLVKSGSDCDDDNVNNKPGALEVCDSVDNNCNGEIDEVYGAPTQEQPHKYYRDLDGDYWGSTDAPLLSLCNSPPPGYSKLDGDCRDDDPEVAPGRAEICNGKDDDCDETVDEPATPGGLLFAQPYDGVTEFQCMGDAGWKVERCPEGRLNCGDESYLDACETIGTTLCNCHACGNTCSFSCGETTCEEIRALSAGLLHTCALVKPTSSATGGTVACWGRNHAGQLGSGDTKDSLVARRVDDLVNVTAISAGEAHNCAIGVGQRLFCWGSNEFGQLGAGVPFEAFFPYPLEVHRSFLGSRATQVASGWRHSCAIYEGGELACWGWGDRGQLGDGRSGGDLRNGIPVQVRREVDGAHEFITNASQIVAGYSHSCALSAGRVECWGDNSGQQLGSDPLLVELATVAQPVEGLVGITVDELSAASGHTCARAGSDVYCWGENYEYQLGHSDAPMGGPIQIPLPIRAVSIVTGSYFGCALGDTGTVYCWGNNSKGQRGTTDDPPSVAPTPIPLSEVTGLFGGPWARACAIRSDGTWCWGDNEHGSLGNGESSEEPQPSPTRVLPLNGSRMCLTR